MTSDIPTLKRRAGAPAGTRQRQERSARILDSAAELYAEKGVSATSIDDIAKRAGVAKGTFYHYFRDRATMIESLRSRFSQHVADAAVDADNRCETEDWIVRLDSWISAVTSTSIANYELHKAIFYSPIRHRFAAGELPVVQNLAVLLEGAQKAGAWSVDDVRATAVFIYSGLQGAVEEACSIGGDTSRIAPQLSRLFSKMLCQK